jgi:outer membrane protein OmpA-like peptidoglycan-associated protein
MIGNQLRLSLNTYDEETQEILAQEQKVLPLGQLHKIHLRQTGYHDTVLAVNTLRPTIFTETELDIPMRPKKSLHHFRVTNIRDNQAVEDAVIRLNGAFASADTALRIGHELALQVSAPGYLFFDTLIHTGDDTRERTIAIRLQPLEKDLVLQLRNIQFEYDSYELTEGSNEALEALAQLLFINPTLRIELSAHTDDLGSDKYNDRLSSLRGQAVAKWLKERGVEADRIESKGYGKRKPLVPNDSDENRALNRRVEIKVTAF